MNKYKKFLKIRLENLTDRLNNTRFEIEDINNKIENLEDIKSDLEDEYSNIKDDISKIKKDFNLSLEDTLCFDEFEPLFIDVYYFIKNNKIDYTLIIPLGLFNLYDMYNRQELFLKLLDVIVEDEQYIPTI